MSVLSVPYEEYGEEYELIGGRLQLPFHGSFRFGSAKHLGENPAGKWTLRISDHLPGSPGIHTTGSLSLWSLTVYGHRSTPGAPDLDSLTPGPGALTVVWKEPTNIGKSAATGYDVRYIKTTDDETDDDKLERGGHRLDLR